MVCLFFSGGGGGGGRVVVFVTFKHFFLINEFSNSSCSIISTI